MRFQLVEKPQEETEEKFVRATQDEDDVNILVNNHIIAWLDAEDKALKVSSHYLERVGLTLEVLD